jgi:nicotinamidase-related amidase
MTMALTTLDPITALIVIDLQGGLMGWPFAHPIGDIVARAAALGAAFRRRGLPVALVNVDGSSPGRTEQPPRHGNPIGGALPDGWTDLIPELDRQPSDIVVTKRTRGAFASTDLESLLRARGVTQVVIAGVATAGGVESTARQAYEAGFNVTLAIDAMTDARPNAHAYSVEHVFPRLGETGSTQAIIDLVERTNAHELA